MAKVTGNEHRKYIARCIETLGRVHNPWTVFDDFLTINATVIGNNCDPFEMFTPKAVRDKRENRYLEIIGRYNESERQSFISMFTELVMELENYCRKDSMHLKDVLGEILSESGLNNHWKGQFFTPQSVSNLMGASVLGDVDECKKIIAEHGFLTVCEPCCGGGSIICGFANAMHEIGLNPQKDVLIYACDIDERCVFMTYIQCSLYGIPAIVQQRNFLTGEILSEPWFTPLFVLNSRRYGDSWKEWLA